MQESNFDVIIIGSGPAGLTAGIYSGRAALKSLIIGGTTPGGQLLITTEVENFPAFPDGIQGPDLVNKMREQAIKFGVVFADEEAVSILGSAAGGFEIKTECGHSYKAKSIIVATGASAKWLGLKNETRLRGKGVSACATCDGYFFKNKVVAVVGGGDAAMEEATFLTKYASKVYVLARNGQGQIRASKMMQKRAFTNPKIEFMYHTEVKDVLGKDFVESIVIIDNKTQKEKTLKVDGLFVAIGHNPNTEFIKGFVDLDEKGYIKSSGLTKTSCEGVFVAGDVSDYRYRQAVTASAFGCMAALDLAKYLLEHGTKVKQNNRAQP